MKKYFFLSFMLMVNFSVFAGNGDVGSIGDKIDLRSSKEFVSTCPEKFLTYIDKAEGGPGAYCDCPDKNISYLDKVEGGPGFYCQK